MILLRYETSEVPLTDIREEKHLCIDFSCWLMKEFAEARNAQRKPHSLVVECVAQAVSTVAVRLFLTTNNVAK